MINKEMKSVVIYDVTVNTLAGNVFEIIPESGLDITETIADAVFGYIFDHSNGAVTILINRLYKFFTPHEIIVRQLARPWISSFGVLCHSKGSEALTKLVVLSSGAKKNHNVRIFSNKAKAVDWLIDQQKNSGSVDRVMR